MGTSSSKAENREVELLNNKEIHEQILKKHEAVIEQLTSEELYTLQQYTFHGDILLNNFLRKKDTIQDYQKAFITYFDELNYNFEKWKEYKNTKIIPVAIPRLYFLPLFLLGYTEDPKQPKTEDEEIERITQRILFYRDTALDIMKENENNLNYFRALVAQFLKQFFLIAKKFPSNTSPFIVYRGIKINYFSEDVNVFNEISSFESTSLNEVRAYNFRRNKNTTQILKTSKTLHYILAPGCQFIYMQPISKIIPVEDEILILPGHRFKFVKKIFDDFDDELLYAVLPPKKNFLNSIFLNSPKNKANNNNASKHYTNLKPWLPKGGGKKRKTRRQRGGFSDIHSNVIQTPLTNKEKDFFAQFSI
jgi:hypothetical protein